MMSEPTHELEEKFAGAKTVDYPNAPGFQSTGSKEERG
jgi:hypothetical protein